MTSGWRDLVAIDAPQRGRREYKHLLPSLQGRRAVSWVTTRAHALREEYQPRQVTSLYFDSAGYSCYRQSNAGASERVKVRLRWYGALETASPLTLEFKHRANHLGWKTQHAFSFADLAECNLRSLVSRFEHALDREERALVSQLRVPILVTSYFRHYFVTADGGVRVTVDTGLRYLDQRLRPVLNLTRDARHCDFAVVECKLEPGRDSHAPRLLCGLPLRHTRFSKYCHALQSLTER